MYMLCIQESYKVVALRWIGIDLAIAGNKMPYPASISLSNLPIFPYSSLFYVPSILIRNHIEKLWVSLVTYIVSQTIPESDS